jgi:NADPH:quinone reductase-like Zn-dependent oxidoreductase
MADNRKNLASVIPTAKARNELQVRPVSKPGAREILVRNHAIAVNPVDWKIQDYTFYVTKYPNVLGSDVAGIVEEVGSEVKHVKKGDRVTGYSGVIWNQNPDEGAFQTYTILQEMATSEW